MTTTIVYRTCEAQVPSGSYGYAKGYASVDAYLVSGEEDEIKIRDVWNSGAGSWSGKTDTSFRGQALADAARICQILESGDTPPDYGYRPLTSTDIEDARERLSRRIEKKAVEARRDAAREKMRETAAELTASLCEQDREAGISIVVVTARTVAVEIQYRDRYATSTSSAWSPSRKQAAARMAEELEWARRRLGIGPLGELEDEPSQSESLTEMDAGAAATWQMP